MNPVQLSRFSDKNLDRAFEVDRSQRVEFSLYVVASSHLLDHFELEVIWVIGTGNHDLFEVSKTCKLLQPYNIYRTLF